MEAKNLHFSKPSGGLRLPPPLPLIFTDRAEGEGTGKIQLHHFNAPSNCCILN